MRTRFHRVMALVAALLATIGLFVWASLGALREYFASHAAERAVIEVRRSQQEVHDLQRQRGLAVLNSRSDAAFDGFSVRIAALNHTVSIREAGALRDGMRMLHAAGEVKEAVAQQRGFLSGIFAAGEFSPREYARFTAIRADREAWLEEFDRVASERQRVALYTALASPEVARYEDIALGGVQGRLPAEADPAKWWASASLVVDRLHIAQQSLADDLIAQARQTRAAAVREVGLSLVLAVLASSGEVLLFIRRHQSSSPDAAATLVTEINSKLLGGATTDECWQFVAQRLTELSAASGVLVLCRHGRRFTAWLGPGVEVLAKLRLTVDDPSLADVLHTGQTLVVDDLSEHSWARGLGPGVAVPMRARRRVRGVLLAVREKGDFPFAADEVAELRMLTSHAAVALELAENQEAKRRSEVLDDRDRIALDMQQLVMRRLVGVGMALQGVLKLITQPRVRERVERAVTQLDEIVLQMRVSIFDLQANGEDGLRRRLLDTVGDLVDGTDVLPVLRVPTAVDALVPDVLIDDVEAAVRELVGSVARHAGATELRLTVQVSDRVTVTVLHDGARLAGFGDVRSRAAELGGVFSVGRDLDGGTRITWLVPLPD